MPATSGSPRFPRAAARLCTGICTGLLLALAGLLALRLRGLALEPARPTAGNEQAFFGWAYRRPDLAARFSRLEAELQPGVPVFFLQARADPGTARWWRFMASYYLAHNPVLGVRPRAAAGAAPAGATLVLLADDGALSVLRRGRPDA